MPWIIKCPFKLCPCPRAERKNASKNSHHLLLLSEGYFLSLDSLSQPEDYLHCTWLSSFPQTYQQKKSTVVTAQRNTGHHNLSIFSHASQLKYNPGLWKVLNRSPRGQGNHLSLEETPGKVAHAILTCSNLHFIAYLMTVLMKNCLCTTTF